MRPDFGAQTLAVSVFQRADKTLQYKQCYAHFCQSQRIGLALPEKSNSNVKFTLRLKSKFAQEIYTYFSLKSLRISFVKHKSHTLFTIKKWPDLAAPKLSAALQKSYINMSCFCLPIWFSKNAISISAISMMPRAMSVLVSTRKSQLLID